MFCTHCGYYLSEQVINRIKTNNSKDLETSNEIKDVYVCPRCGKLIKENVNQDEVKELARASHSEIHKAKNNINSGMSFLIVGLILFCVGILFFVLSFKAANHYKFETNCVEFYTFCGLAVISIALFVLAFYNLIKGRKNIKLYSKVLSRIQTDTFIQ